MSIETDRVLSFHLVKIHETTKAFPTGTTGKRCPGELPIYERDQTTDRSANIGCFGRTDPHFRDWNPQRFDETFDMARL